MDYYTIDFETANSSPTSACSIGIVGVQNSKVVLEEYYLINPKEYFDPYNTLIHSIKEEDIKDALTFDLLWKKIKKYFNNTIVFSHYSLFDFSVLKALLAKYNLEIPIFRFGCTVKASRLVWKDNEVLNHKLNTLASYLEIDFNHHNALSDALVCAHIIIRAMKITSTDDIYSFYSNLNLRFGYLGPRNFYNTYQLQSRSKKQMPKINNSLLYDKMVILSGVPKSLKKKELINLVINNGGYVDSLVDHKCDIFVMLGNYKEEKLNQAKLLQNNGFEILIINEEELLEMVKR